MVNTQKCELHNSEEPVMETAKLMSYDYHCMNYFPSKQLIHIARIRTIILQPCINMYFFQTEFVKYFVT